MNACPAETMPKRVSNVGRKTKRSGTLGGPVAVATGPAGELADALLCLVEVALEFLDFHPLGFEAGFLLVEPPGVLAHHDGQLFLRGFVRAARQSKDGEQIASKCALHPRRIRTCAG